MKSGLREGHSHYYHPNGQISNDQKYKDNKVSGPCKVFYSNGKVEMNGSYWEDLKTGE